MMKGLCVFGVRIFACLSADRLDSCARVQDCCTGRNQNFRNLRIGRILSMVRKSLTLIMPYDEKLAKRIRERFAVLDNVDEKEMMGGLTFMYNGKMCVGIIKDELMCRIDPVLHDEVIERRGCRTMDFTKRPMKGYVMVGETGIKSKKEFEYWIELSLAYNSKAKASKKKKK